MDEAPKWGDWFAERPIRAITEFACTLVEAKTLENNQRQFEAEARNREVATGPDAISAFGPEEVSLAKIDDLLLLVSEGIIVGNVKCAAGDVKWLYLFRNTRSCLLETKHDLSHSELRPYYFNELARRHDDLFIDAFCRHNLHRRLLDDLFIHPRDVAAWLARNPLWHSFIPESMLEYLEAASHAPEAPQPTTGGKLRGYTSIPKRKEEQRSALQKGVREYLDTIPIEQNFPAWTHARIYLEKALDGSLWNVKICEKIYGEETKKDKSRSPKSGRPKGTLPS